MDKDALIDILNGMLRNRDFSKLTEVVPYEDRFALFMKTHEIKIENQYVYQMMMEYIFTMEEATTLFDQIDDKNKKKILFEFLSDEDKIKYIDEIDIDSYAISGFLDSVKDEKQRLNFLVKFMNDGKIFSFSLRNFIGKFTGKNKFDYLDAIIEYFKTKGEKINSFDYADYVEQFPSEDRIEVLNKLLTSVASDNIYSSQVANCLKVFDDQDKIRALDLIITNNLEDYKQNFYSVAEVILCFPEEDFLKIFNKLCEYELINQYNITNAFEKLSVEQCETIIDSNIDNKEMITSYVVAKLIDKVSKEEGKRIYKKYTIDSNNFGNLSVARRMKDIEDTYYYIDYLIGEVNPPDFEKAFDSIDENLFAAGKYPKGDNEYPNIIDMYAKKYSLDKIHLREFIKRFDYNALRYMNSKNVRAAINLSDEEFVKFMNIFSHGTMLDNNIINSICNSFLQRQFRLESKDDYTIFTQFELLLANKDDETQIKVAELLVKVGEVVNIDTYLEKNGLTFDQFVFNLINNDKVSIDLLHDMTQEYIMKKREIYVKDKLNTVFDEIGVVKKVEKNAYKKKMLEISSEFDIRYLFQSIPEQYLTEEEKELTSNRELLDRLIKFKKEHTPLEDPSEKKHLRTFESLFNKAYEYKYDAKKFEGMEGLPYSYFPVEPSVDWLLGVIVECNVNQVSERILNDKQVYSELIAFIDKYKMLGWDKTFNSFSDRAEVEFTEGTMASIIANYYTISAIAKEKDANLTQFIDYANCYDSLSKTYAYILGKDNYRAIAANEGKNKADMSKADRLGRVPKLIQGMYAREEITTPSIDKVYETFDGKKLNVVLGNSTNMMNLSYGERTNSCLRIGGAFNNLFEFCIHDKNGFHVRFTDPETGEFISRVSGIRNGNTIFFNELRDSENPNYNNEQIIEVLNQLSSELIEMTKDEECPIDNVVITYDYAMRNYEQSAIPTGLKDYPNAFYGLRFNIAFDGNFVLLKSTSPNGGLVPYEFGADLARTYETQRDKVVTLTNHDMALEKVMQLHLIDGILKGYEIDELSLDIPTNVDMCIAGEDWCVYKDSEGNIHQFIVEMSKHKGRALEEMKIALEQLKNAVVEQSQNKAMGV